MTCATGSRATGCRVMPDHENEFRDASRPFLRRMTLIERDATLPTHEADVRDRREHNLDQGVVTSGPQRRSNEGWTRRDPGVGRGAGAGRRRLRRRGNPRDHEGRETLDARVVDEVVTKVRDACGVPVGVTTSAEIEPDPERRLALVRAWRAPDYTSVNLSELGATEVMEALIGAGVGIEVGVWTAEDTQRLAASGLGGRVTRILV